MKLTSKKKKTIYVTQGRFFMDFFWIAIFDEMRKMNIIDEPRGNGMKKMSKGKKKSDKIRDHCHVL